MYDKRLDKGKAEIHTINDFLKEVKERFNGKSMSVQVTSNPMFISYSENTKNECQERIESLKQAWALVRHKLKNHRLPIEEKIPPVWEITLKRLP